MQAPRTLIALSVAALVAACAGPGGTHPESHGATAGPAAAGAADPRMKAMHDMHQKMANAGTPAARQALMAEHMKAMQGGMAMMKEMHARHAGMGDGKGMHADMAHHHQMMAEHLTMMHKMMEAMAEHGPHAAPGK